MRYILQEVDFLNEVIKMPADLDYIVIINPEITDVLFHVIVSFILALIVNVRFRRHKYLWYILSAIGINGFIDADHLIAPYFGGVNIFHNMFVFVIFPLLAYGLAFVYARKHAKPVLPAIFVMIFAITLSHLYLDTVSGTPIYLQYPLSTTKYIFNPGISVATGYVLLRTQECGLILLAIIGLALNRVAAYHQGAGAEEIVIEPETKMLDVKALKKVRDRKMARILYLLAKRPFAPHEITRITGIPLTEVYVCIHTLKSLGLVELRGVRYFNGTRIQFYEARAGRVYATNNAVYITAE